MKTSVLNIRWANNGNQQQRATKGQLCWISRAWSVEPTRMEIYDVNVGHVSNLRSFFFLSTKLAGYFVMIVYVV